jgi:hypothetical protein
MGEGRKDPLLIKGHPCPGICGGLAMGAADATGAGNLA